MKKLSIDDKIASISKKKSSKINLVIPGYEPVVDRAIERGRKIDSLKTEQDMDLEMLRAVAVEHMYQYEESGRFTKTAYISGTETNASVTRKDSFSKLDIGNKSTLIDIVGDELYSQLYEEKVEVKLVGSFEMLRKQCAKAGIDIEAYFSVTEYIAPCDNFLESRAKLRGSLDERKNSSLDKLTENIAYTPSVRLK